MIALNVTRKTRSRGWQSEISVLWPPQRIFRLLNPSKEEVVVHPGRGNFLKQ